MTNRSTTLTKQPIPVSISRNWQLAFVISLFASQLIYIGSILWTYFRYTHYMSAGTWLFQIIQFGYPLVFFGAAYGMVRSTIPGRLPRTFWATMLATIGCVISSSLQIPINMAINALHLSLVKGNDDGGILDAFGLIWIQMGVIFVLYVAVLWYVFRKVKRA